MKRMKKLFAILMTMAMVMGLGITGFAATKTTIRVDNLAPGSTISYLHIIEPSTNKTTGWAFTDDAKNVFISAFEITGNDQEQDEKLQNVIKDMQNNRVDAGKLAQALNNLNADDFTPVSSGSSFEVSSAGVYAIIAVDDPDSDSKTMYSRMTAYVAFAYNDGVANGVQVDEVVVNAKKSQVPTQKDAQGMTDETVGIGDTVTYDITTAIPYDKKTWTITDSITGAKYKTNTDGKLTVKITLGNETPVVRTIDVGAYDPITKTQTFTINLEEFLGDKDNFGKTLIITYDAEVTAETVENTAHNSNGDPNGSKEELFTGYITFTKNGEGSKALAGAGFKVKNKDSEEWATFTGSNGVYTLTGWTKEEDSATEVFTFGDNGNVQVRGLDAGEYVFKETTAPTGYSLSNKTEEVALSPESSVATAVFSATGAMADTKLSALPSTGGMGTTIFTIAGCVIMISAAGLFFASRRKAN